MADWAGPWRKALASPAHRAVLGGLSAENYIAITGASRATATRDLKDLVLKGALTRTGERRHTRYWLNLPSSEK